MAEIELNQGSPRRIGCLVAAIFAVLLGVLIFVVLSARNSSVMELRIDEEGRLAVFKGSFLPWGEVLYEPNPAFAPIDVPSGVARDSLPLGICEDEVDCEARFYHSVIQMTETLLAEPSSEGLARSKELIVRAQIFPSIPLSERGPIEDLTGAIHYVEAIVILEESRSQLERARKKLERSRISEVPFVEGARLDAMIEIVNQQLKLSDKLQLQLEPLDGAL